VPAIALIAAGAGAFGRSPAPSSTSRPHAVES
jgi:hypothetical protein